MTYTHGDNRRLIHALALENGWTGSRVSLDTEVWKRRESNVVIAWTGRDTVHYASINIQDSAGRIPAPPRMGLVKAREWLSAPGEYADQHAHNVFWMTAQERNNMESES